MKKLLLALLCCFLLMGANAQADSIAFIRSKLTHEQPDSVKFTLLNKLSRYYFDDQRDSAIYYIQEMLGLAKKMKNARSEDYAIGLLARANWDGGNFAEALKLSLEGMELAIELKDTVSEFKHLRQIMWIYGSVQNYPKGLEYGQKLRMIAGTHAVKNSSFAEIALTSALNGIGNAYKELGQNDSALFYFKQSLAIFAPRPQVWKPRSVVAYYLGNFFRKNGMPDSALYYYRLSLANSPDQQNSQAEVFLDYGSIFFDKQMMDSAYFYAKKSLPIARAINDSGFMMQASFLLADIFNHLHKPDSAYGYLRDAVTIQRLRNKTDDLNKTANMLLNESLYKQQLEQQRMQAEQQYKSNLKLYSLFGVVAVFLLLSIIQYRNSKQRQKSAQEIKASYEKLKATQAQLIQSEKMASLGELTAGIAHEIQNPLNFVNNFSEINTELIGELVEEVDNGNTAEVKAIAGDIQQNLEKINHHGKRADAIVKGMLEHSRTSSGQKVPTDLNALCEEYLRLAYHGLRAKDKSFNADFTTQFDDSIGKINIVSQDIGRVLLNIINNAFYAVHEKQQTAGEGYKPLVELKTEKEGGNVVISVKDNGNGIADPIKEKIFQPFFTTKPTGQGTGLGLSLSYDIVKANGGKITVDSAIGTGSTFIITLQANT